MLPRERQQAERSKLTKYAVTYDDMHVNFTWEEWTLLNTSQRNIYKDVMLKTYRNLTTIGYNWGKHHPSSRRYERHKRRQNAGKLTMHTQWFKALSYDSPLQRHERTQKGEKLLNVTSVVKSLLITVLCKKELIWERNPINAINVVKPVNIQGIFKCIKQHILERNPMNVVSGKAFAHHDAFSSHKRTHTGEKPYECSQCGKAYACQHNIQMHKRTYTGEKPYECNQWGKAFVQHSNLQRHKRIHTKEKPYIFANSYAREAELS
ncbi:hypothetical protein STEG23_015068 [Scotinomys teguina]